MKKAIEAFPISQEEADDVDQLRETFPNKADLRSVLEDYFHIFDDYAKMPWQEFDMYFEDYMKDYKESEFVDDIQLKSSCKLIKSSRSVNEANIKRDAKRILDAVKYLTPLKNEMVESPDDSKVKYSIGEQLNNIKDAVQSILGEIGSADTITSSRKSIKSGRVEHYRDAYVGGMINRDEFKELLKEEGYDDSLAESLINQMCKITSSKIGKVHDEFIRGEISENQLKKELADNGYEDDVIEKLSEKWKRKILKSSMDEQQKQDLKESLIRAGYSEQEADSILQQAEQMQ